MLLAWLRTAKEEWENEAEQRLLEPVTLEFPFEEHNPDAVDARKRPHQDSFPHGQFPSPKMAEARKRSNQEASPFEVMSPPLDGHKKAKMLDAGAADKGTHSALQLRCESGTVKRVLVVWGASFLRLVAIALAEAFGVPGGEFDLSVQWSVSRWHKYQNGLQTSQHENPNFRST